MAVLKGSVIGELSGKLGNLAARCIGGRTILGRRPVSFNVNYSPVLVEIRKKFAVTVSFVNNMLSLSALLAIWDKVKQSGMTVYNYGVKQNFNLSTADKPTVDNMLTPMDGFPLPVTAAAVDVDAVTAQIDALDTVMIVTAEEREYIPNVLICYYSPTDPDDAPYAVVPVQAASQILDTLNPIAINIPLNVVQKAIAAKYQNSILYLALSTHDDDGKVVQYSATYAQDN